MNPIVSCFARLRRALPLVAVALLCARSTSLAQVSLTTATGLTITGQTNGQLQIFDAASTQLMFFDGLRFALGSASPATSTATPSLVTVNGRQAIQMNYAITGDTTGSVVITGRFTPVRDTVQVHFDISANAAPGTSTIKYRAIPSGTTKAVSHQSLWLRDVNGGVPYEVDDVHGFQYTFPSAKYALVNLPNSNLSWTDSWSANLPLTAVSSTQWSGDATFALVQSTSTRPTAGGALVGGRPLGLDLWTIQPYNLWDSSTSPLTLKSQVANTSSSTKTMALSWWARDYSGAVVGSGNASQSLASGAVWNRDIPFTAPARGVLFTEVAAESIDPTQTLRWRLDETGAPASAADATGNGRAGAITGNVAGGATGQTGGAFSGFTSTTSRIYYDTGSTTSPLAGANVTAALWLKNPGSAARNVILGFGANSSGGNRAVELAVGPDNGSGQRVLSLSHQNWNGGHAVYSSSPIIWETNTWYQLALVWKNLGSQVYSYELYLTPDDALSLGSPVLAGTLGTSGGPGPANGAFFYVGGHSAGYYSSFQPAGYFGGAIDTVSLWLGQALSPALLYENLTSNTFRRTNLAVLPAYTFAGPASGSLFGLSATFKLPDAATELNLLKRLGVRHLRQPTYTLAQADSIGAKQIQHSNTTWTSPVGTTWIDGELNEAVSLGADLWEAGNEMNLSSSPASTYVTNFLIPTKNRALAIAPGVKIMNGGLAGWAPAFAQGLVDSGGWPYLDAFAVHPGRGNFTADYPGENNEISSPNSWSFLGAVRRAKAFMDVNGVKPLYLTETYACTSPNDYWHDTYRNAAEAVLMSFAIAQAEGVKVMHFYQLNDTIWSDVGGVSATNPEYHFGLLNRDLSLKASALAYATIAEALDQATFVRWMNFPDPKAHGILFNSPARGNFAVVWHRADGYVLSANTPTYAAPEAWVDQWSTGTNVALLAAGSACTVWDTLGRSSSVATSGGRVTLALDGSPQLVFGLSADAGQTITVDNADPSGVTLTGSWTVSSYDAGYHGTNYLHDGNTGKGTKSVKFTPAIPVTGTYAVRARWSASTSRSSAVPIAIVHAGGTANVTVNQQANGNQWVTLGSYTFNTGAAGNVTISTTGTTGYVIADAVQFVRQ